MKLKEKILQDTPYIPVYRFTLQKFSTQQAMLLSFLIDADSYASVRLKEDNDYFKCTDSFIKRQVYLSSPTIKKYLDNLVNDGMIFIRLVKVNNVVQRFIKLNQVKLIDMYEQFNKIEKQTLYDTEEEIVYLRPENQTRLF